MNHEKIESAVSSSSAQLDIRKWRFFDMQRRMACVQGIVYPPRARHGCTQWLHKPQLFVEGQVFQHKSQVQLSSTQPHLEQPPWRWPKDVPLRMKTM
jgi:hypothetical protein